MSHTDCVEATRGGNWDPTYHLLSGFYQLDLTTFEWISLDESAGLKGGGPDPRAGHASTAMGTELYIAGGTNFRKNFGDLWRYTCVLFVVLYIYVYLICILQRILHTCIHSLTLACAQESIYFKNDMFNVFTI